MARTQIKEPEVRGVPLTEIAKARFAKVRLVPGWIAVRCPVAIRQCDISMDTEHFREPFEVTGQIFLLTDENHIGNTHE